MALRQQEEGDRRRSFPIGAAISAEQLELDPHPVLDRLRPSEPVSWLPSLGGWLITRHDLAVEVMRDATRFTVDDPRLSTGQVVGPSMLSLDGDDHARHRTPFAAPFRPGPVRERLGAVVAGLAAGLVEEMKTNSGVDRRSAAGSTAGVGARAELRSAFAGPLAALTIGHALGLPPGTASRTLDWYRAIVGSVNSISAGRGATAEGAAGFAELADALRAVMATGSGASLLGQAAGGRALPAGGPALSGGEIVSNAAVLLFGGIETTEAMIANAALHLLGRTELADRVRAQPELLDGVIEESLRLEPGAAVVDRYATTDVVLAGARIRRGDLVRVSLAGANRDPAVFADPHQFDPHRFDPGRRRTTGTGAGGHLTFAQGPHVCLGVHLARLEARVALMTLLTGLPALRVDPARPARITGLVFRKPPELWVRWG